MRDIHERIDAIRTHFINMSDDVDRFFQINLKMLEKEGFDGSLHGEAMIIEDRINAYEIKIMEDIVESIARFQPAASYLRELISFINCIKILERIGDLLKGVFKLRKELDEFSNINKEIHNLISQFAIKINEDFKLYVEAFKKEEEEVVYKLLGEYKVIDRQRANIVSKITEEMKKDKDYINYGNLSLVIAYKLERIDNKIMDLGKNLVYAVNGTNLRKKELKEILR